MFDDLYISLSSAPRFGVSSFVFLQVQLAFRGLIFGPRIQKSSVGLKLGGCVSGGGCFAGAVNALGNQGEVARDTPPRPPPHHYCRLLRGKNILSAMGRDRFDGAVYLLRSVHVNEHTSTRPSGLGLVYVHCPVNALTNTHSSCFQW